MKVLFLCLTIFAGSHCLFGNFYQFTLPAADDTIINTSDYEGKKVLIAVVGANSSGDTLVHFLDSVQASRTDLQVIAVPTGDFGSSTLADSLTALMQNTAIVFTKPVGVIPNSDAQQHPLFRWLTQAAENGHFNAEVEGEGQMYIVGPQGSLVAVCSKYTERPVLLSLLDQSMNE